MPHKIVIPGKRKRIYKRESPLVKMKFIKVIKSLIFSIKHKKRIIRRKPKKRRKTSI